MKFTLHYEGPLKSANARNSRGDKHEIRRHIKSQLAVLWKQLPWRDFHDYHFGGPQMIVTQLRGIRFAPLISEKKHLTASLKINLLSADDKGAIIVKTADVDNRLKVLFDALRSPSCESELPSTVEDEDKNGFFYTLLEDDALITSCRIQSDRLLKPATPNVILLVEVTVSPVNFPIGGLRVQRSAATR